MLFTTPGGITGDVKLLVVPAVRLSDVYVIPDWITGKARVQTTVLNTSSGVISSSLSLELSEASNGNAFEVGELYTKD